jgi:hypothetical protein
MNASFDNDENYQDKISLDELYDRRREVDVLRMNVYHKILNRIHTKIKYKSRQNYNDTYIFYVVPEFMMGVPRYNVKHCTIYIIDKLKENGFHVKYTHPNMLFISWGHYIPSYERDSIKKKYGVQVDGFGKVLKKSNEKLTSSFSNDQSSKPIFKDVSTYKPLGIYTDKIVKSTEKRL